MDLKAYFWILKNDVKAKAIISGFLQFIMQTRVDLGAHLNPQSLENVNIPEGGQLYNASKLS